MLPNEIVGEGVTRSGDGDVCGQPMVSLGLGPMGKEVGVCGGGLWFAGMYLEGRWRRGGDFGEVPSGLSHAGWFSIVLQPSTL